MEHILLIDDDLMILKATECALNKENIKVTKCQSGLDGLELIKKNSFNAIILDILMPDINGFDLIKKIRDLNIYTPIIIISGKEEEYNKILGLGLGADDYLTKPFSIHLLISKIKALIRRETAYAINNNSVISVGPFQYRRDKMEFYKDGKLLDLTSKETMLLNFFLENTNRVFSKEQLYQSVWHETAIDDNTIMVYIKRLRSKIEDDSKNPKYIKTVWGIGYMLSI